MKILYCSWNENSSQDAIDNLRKIADDIVCMNRTVREYLDGRAENELKEKLSEDISYVFSFDFFPVVSSVCKEKNIPYISLVYDWPNYTIFDPAIYNDINQVYLFERDGITMMENYRVHTIDYMPLPVDVDRLDRMFPLSIEKTKYLYDVSFVGNMYLKKSDAMFTENIPDYYSGYVDALVNAQQKIYGYNLINEIVDKKFTQQYLYQINGKLDMNVPEQYVLATQINRLVTGVERRELLNAVAKQNKLHLFTQQSVDGLENMKIHSGVDYRKEMPKVFRESKINLNITLRSITSGIPLRVFDILGAGGFCLTNYQAGIEEHFVDGEDLVVFTSKEDLLEKVQYYLTHEDERMRIALHGHEKVKEYSYEKIFGKMFCEK